MAKEENGGKNGPDPAKAVAVSGANNGSNGDSNISNEIPPKINSSVVVVSTVGSLPESQKSVVLNVGGQRYETLKRNFANFPGPMKYKTFYFRN
jgi:hypothetical protein